VGNSETLSPSDESNLASKCAKNGVIGNFEANLPQMRLSGHYGSIGKDCFEAPITSALVRSPVKSGTAHGTCDISPKVISLSIVLKRPLTPKGWLHLFRGLIAFYGRSADLDLHIKAAQAMGAEVADSEAQPIAPWWELQLLGEGDTAGKDSLILRGIEG
jgi:hypothetical protein